MSNETPSGPSLLDAVSQRHFLFTYPRTASHLLMRMLGLDEHESIASHPPEADDYFFMPMIGILRKFSMLKVQHQEASDSDKTKIRETLQACAKRMELFIQQSEADGKLVFVKEHVQFIAKPDIKDWEDDNGIFDPAWTARICGTSAPNRSDLNQTIFPRGFLLSLRPTFLIRHPALVLPSFYRATKASGLAPSENMLEINMDLMTSLQPVRNLFDWYGVEAAHEPDDVKKQKLVPIVLDANDVINSPEILMEYSHVTGLDIATISTNWSEYAEGDLAKLKGTSQQAFLSTLVASKGVMKQKAPPLDKIDIDSEAGKWCSEFGDNIGGMIQRLVERAMPDYEYLHSKRLTINA